MSEKRNFICSVLFLDIAEYSKYSVTEQIRMREQFNATLREAIADIAVNERIILDTGDGAAVSFLGDPEDAMYVGLTVRDMIAHQALGGQPLLIRYGINLGPIRVVKGINGQPSTIGDGINVAQRVMSFADPGQILVSRSYHDVMARLSEDYAGMFQYEGSKTDKHVREHEVYALNLAANPQPSRRRWFNVSSKLLVAVPLAFVLIVGAGFGLRTYRQNLKKPAHLAAVTAPAPAPQSAAPAADATQTSKSEAPTAPAMNPAETSDAAKAGKPQAADAQAEAPKTAPVSKSPARKAHAPKVKTSQAVAPKTQVEPSRKAEPVRMETPPAAAPAPDIAKAPPAAAKADPNAAIVSVLALPWAEVFVDSKRQGVSPPLRTLTVSPGKHLVELRNTNFPIFSQTIDAKPGERVTIAHRFRSE